MSLFVLDTDTLVLFQQGHEVVCRRVLSHTIEELAISVITVEEQLSGWYTLLRRAKSVETLERAIGEFQRLKAQKLGVKHMDLRIAAITVEHAGTLVTRNTRDFQRISGLAIEDWSVQS
jgi:tRNA(fMet)-specific endonuclease VapC